MQGFYGSEKHTKFYIAGVVCALEHMHERRIIHRDIKPENLLLNEKGHLKACAVAGRPLEMGYLRGAAGMAWGAPQCRVDKTHGTRTPI